MTTCLACSCNIPGKKNRCSLNEQLLTTLNKLSPSVVSTAVSGKYVCKRCKLKLQRLHLLKKQVSELQKSIFNSLPSTVQIIHLLQFQVFNQCKFSHLPLLQLPVKLVFKLTHQPVFMLHHPLQHPVSKHTIVHLHLQLQLCKH